MATYIIKEQKPKSIYETGYCVVYKSIFLGLFKSYIDVFFSLNQALNFVYQQKDCENIKIN